MIKFQFLKYKIFLFHKFQVTSLANENCSVFDLALTSVQVCGELTPCLQLKPEINTLVTFSCISSLGVLLIGVFINYRLGVIKS